MTLLVVDASVVIKWFVPEIHSDAARKLLGTNHQFFAPDLLFAEIGNILWKKAQRGSLTSTDAAQLIADIGRVAIESVPARSLVGDAFVLANAIRRTVYDSLYLALAARLNTSCITADERLWRATRAIPAAAPLAQLLR